MPSAHFYCEKTLSGEIKIEVVKETSNVLAFKHTKPYWETHVVIIPKKHIESLSKATDADHSILGELMLIASEICARIEAEEKGCRLSTKIGTYQSAKHLHFYVHAGERLRDEDGNPLGGDH
jgi:histidine triad (HIT) family protein